MRIFPSIVPWQRLFSFRHVSPSLSSSRYLISVPTWYIPNTGSDLMKALRSRIQAASVSCLSKEHFHNRITEARLQIKSQFFSCTYNFKSMNKVNDYFLIVISRYMKKHCTYHWTVFIQSATEMNMSISNFKLNQV